MTNFSTISVPTEVFDEVNEVHKQHSEEWEPKWLTVRRAVQEFDDESDEATRGQRR